MALDYLVDYCLLFALHGGEYHIGIVLSLHGLVGGDLHYVEGVYRAELGLLCLGCTRHARELFIQAEIVLESDGGVRLVLVAHLYVLLCLYRLVKAVGIAPAVHKTAGEFVDDEYLAVVGDDIVLVALEQLVRLQSLLYVVVKIGVFYIGEILYAEEALGLLRALFGYSHRLFLAVDDIIPVLHLLKDGGKALVGLLLLLGKILLSLGGGVLFGVLLVVVKTAGEGAHEPVDVLIELGTLAALAGDYERGARLVDEY